MAFSEDGSFFAASRGKGVLICGIDSVLGFKMKPTPIILQSTHYFSTVKSLAFSPDNSRVFSCSGQVIVHDTISHHVTIT